jgi:uncharacterized protein
MAVGTETGRRVARQGAVYKRRPFLTFYLLTLAISWSFWIPVAASHQALIPFWPSTLFLIAGAFGPSLAAIMLTAMDDGKTAVRVLFSGLLKWRVGVRWYLVVLLLPAVFCLSAVALHVLLGGVAPRLYKVPFRGTCYRPISCSSCSSSAR